MSALPAKTTPEIEGKIALIAGVLRSVAISQPKLAASDAQALLETLLETRSSFLASSEIFPSAGQNWELRLVRD